MKRKALRPSPSDSATNFKIGDVRKGNDGAKYVVRKAGKSRRSFRRDRSPLRMDADLRFSDGFSLGFSVRDFQIMLFAPEEPGDIDNIHINAIFSQNPIKIIFPEEGLTDAQKQISLSGVVTVKKIINALTLFYKKPISDSRYRYILKDSKLAYKYGLEHATLNDFKKEFRTNSHLRGDHVFLEGLVRLAPRVYSLDFGS